MELTADRKIKKHESFFPSISRESPHQMRKEMGAPKVVSLEQFSDLVFLINIDTTIEEFHERSITMIKAHTSASWVEFLLLEDGSLTGLSKFQQFERLPLNPDDSLPAFVAVHREPYAVTNSFTNPFYQHFPFKLAPVSLITKRFIKPNSVACVPVIDSEGTLQGVIQLFNKASPSGIQSYFTDKDLMNTENLCCLLAEILKTKRKFLKLDKEHTESLQLLRQFSKFTVEDCQLTINEMRLREYIDMISYMKVISPECLVEIAKILRCEGAVLYSKKPDRLQECFSYNHSIPNHSMRRMIKKFNIFTKGIARVSDIWLDQETSEYNHCILVPIFKKDDEPSGVIVFFRENEFFFKEEEKVFLEIASSLTVVEFSASDISIMNNYLQKCVSFDASDDFLNIANIIKNAIYAMFPCSQCFVHLADYDRQSLWMPGSTSLPISFKEKCVLNECFQTQRTICLPCSDMEHFPDYALNNGKFTALVPVICQNGSTLSIVKVQRTSIAFNSSEISTLELLTRYFGYTLERCYYRRNSFKGDTCIVNEYLYASNQKVLTRGSFENTDPFYSVESMYLNTLQILMETPHSELMSLKNLIEDLKREDIEDVDLDLSAYLSCDKAAVFVFDSLKINLNTLSHDGSFQPTANILESIEKSKTVHLNTLDSCKSLDKMDLLGYDSVASYLCVPIVNYSSVQGVLIAVRREGSFSYESIALAEFLSCILAEILVDDFKRFQWFDVQESYKVQRFLTRWSKQIVGILNNSTLRYNRCKKIVFSNLDSQESLLKTALNLIIDYTNSQDAVFIMKDADTLSEFSVEKGLTTVISYSDEKEDFFNWFSNKSCLGVPIYDKSNQQVMVKVTGKKDITDTRLAKYTNEDIELIKSIGEMLKRILFCKELPCKKVCEEISIKLKDLAAGYQNNSFFEVSRLSVKHLSMCEKAYIYRYKHQTFSVLSQDMEQSVNESLLISQMTPLLQSVIVSRHTQYIKNIQSDSNFNPQYNALACIDAQSMLFIPLFNSLGKVIGVIHMVNLQNDDFDVFESLANIISGCMENWFNLHTQAHEFSMMQQILNTLGSYVLVFNEEKRLIYSNQAINELLGHESSSYKASYEEIFPVNSLLIKDINEVYNNFNVKVRKTSEQITSNLVFNYSIMRLQDVIKNKPSSEVMLILEDASAIESLKSDFQAFNKKLQEIVSPIDSTTTLQSCIKTLEVISKSISDQLLSREVEKIIETLKSGSLNRARIRRMSGTESISDRAITSLIDIYTGTDLYFDHFEEGEIQFADVLPSIHGTTVALEGLRDWDLNVFEIKEKNTYVSAMLEDFNLMSLFRISPSTLLSFVDDLEKVSKPNPFHNFLHCFNVMHGTYVLLASTMLGTYLSPLEILGLLIAALCHDLDHTGRSNMFEINSRSCLALRYHDKSVLENHHAAVAFQIMNKDRSNIFKNLSTDRFKEVRKLIVYSILGTDMSKHARMISFMTERFKEVDESPIGTRENDINKLCQFVLHCGDLSHCTKRFDVYEIWSRLVCQEFTAQFNEEVRLKIPVTEFYKNLDDPKVYYSNEVGFLNFVINPLWECANLLLAPNIDFIMDGLKNNLSIMKKKLDEWKQVEGN